MLSLQDKTGEKELPPSQFNRQLNSAHFHVNVQSFFLGGILFPFIALMETIIITAGSVEQAILHSPSHAASNRVVYQLGAHACTRPRFG